MADAPRPSQEPDSIRLGGQGAIPDWLQDRLFQRRELWLSGPLDEPAATALAARLVAMDGSGDETVWLHLNSGSGSLSGALTVMDTIAALGVPVEAVGRGRAEGPALGVLAVAHRRYAAAHCRIRLSLPELAIEGGTEALARRLEQHRIQVERFTSLVAAATRQPAERVEVDLAAGRYFELDEAVSYGLLDRVWEGGNRRAG